MKILNPTICNMLHNLSYFLVSKTFLCLSKYLKKVDFQVKVGMFVPTTYFNCYRITVTQTLIKH